MATLRTRCHVDEIARLDRHEPVPNASRHDVRVAGAQHHLGLDADGSLVAVVEDQFHRPVHNEQEFVAIGMDLAGMRSRSFDVRDCSDRVSVDSLRRSRRSGCDGHRPVAGDVCNVAGKVNGRRVSGSRHAHSLPPLR